MSLTQEVKDFATTQLDVDLIGVSSADRLSGAPEGHRPADLLPGAKSVIVMAVGLVQGVVQTIFRAYEDGLRHAQCIYGTHGYALIPNLHLKYAAYRMARFIEKKGFMTTPLPSGPGGGGAPFSHRHAAVAAGLGEFGRMSIVLTPQFGLLKKSLGFKDLPVPENPTMQQVDQVRKEIDPRQLSEANFPVDRATWYCGKCLAYCPVGQQA